MKRAVDTIAGGGIISKSKTMSKTQQRKIRILVAKPGLRKERPNGHDRGALVLCRALRDAGMEVIYAGLLASPEEDHKWPWTKMWMWLR